MISDPSYFLTPFRNFVVSKRSIAHPLIKPCKYKIKLMRGYKGELAAYFHFTEAKNVCQVESFEEYAKNAKRP